MSYKFAHNVVAYECLWIKVRSSETTSWWPE